MLMHTGEGTTIVTEQEKVKNETRQQINNSFQSFQRLCSVWSFLLSRIKKHHYSFATGSFHFRTGQAKLSQAHSYSIHFLKVRHFPGKIDNKPLPGVFLEASLPLQQTFKTVLSSDFYTARDLSRLDWFHDCSSSPCRFLLISKPTLCKTILSSSFVLESCTKTDKLFLLLWRHSLPKSREKQWVLHL